MLGYTWYHETIKRYVIVFGSLFNDIEVLRHDTKTNKYQKIKVPLNYGPRDKVLAAAQRDYDGATAKVATVTPRLSFEMGAPMYDPSRKMQSLNKVCGPDNKYYYSPTPYIFPFTVSVLAKNIDDANAIVEQILPFFSPHLTIQMHPIKGNNDISHSAVVTLDNVSKTETYQGDFDSRETIMWDLQFSLKGWLYGPLRGTGAVIKKIFINYKGVDETAIIWPGLTANGLPTTDANVAVNYATVEEDDDWAYIIQYEQS